MSPKTLDKDQCEDIDICRTCSPPAPTDASEHLLDNCEAVPHIKYYVSNYYSVTGVDKMKSELVQYGPISCGIEVTEGFEKYTGGIYSEKLLDPILNHEISIVGYGKDDDGYEFWIGRNSWGSYWGEMGFLRIKMREDNLGIESDCRHPQLVAQQSDSHRVSQDHISNCSLVSWIF